MELAKLKLGQMGCGMKALFFQSRLIPLFAFILCLGAPVIGAAQTNPFAIKIELSEAKLRPGQAVNGRVSAVILPSQTPLTNPGINFVIFTSSADMRSLNEEIKKLPASQAQKKLETLAANAGKGSGLLLQRVSGRVTVHDGAPLSLPLDHNGPLYPRISESDLSLMERGKFRLTVVGVLSGLDDKGKEALSYAIDEVEMEVEPLPLKVSFIPGLVRPAEQSLGPGAPVSLSGRYVVEGLPLNGSAQVEIVKTMVEKSQAGESKGSDTTVTTQHLIKGNADGSPVTRPHRFSATFPQSGDFEISLSAAVTGSKIKAQESVLFRVSASQKSSQDSASLMLPPLIGGGFSASLKVNNLEISPKDGVATTLPIVVSGVDLSGPPLQVQFETVEDKGTLKMNRFLTVVGKGSHSPQDIPLDSDGGLLWPLKIQAKPGIMPGLYALPITVFQEPGIESRLLLTLIIRPDGPLPLGVLSQGWMAMPGGVAGDGAGLGGGSVNPANKSGQPDPAAAFQALIDPGDLTLRPGGGAGRARVLIQGLSTTSQLPLEVIFVAADQGVLPGGITVSPGTVSRAVSQLATTEFEGKTWYVVNLDFTASAIAIAGTYSYEVVVRQSGRGAGTLIMTISVDEEGRLTIKRNKSF
jgi:hypothetical protein